MTRKKQAVDRGPQDPPAGQGQPPETVQIAVRVLILLGLVLLLVGTWRIWEDALLVAELAARLGARP